MIKAEDNSATIEITQPKEQAALEFKNNFSVPPPDLELCVELDRNDEKNSLFYSSFNQVRDSIIITKKLDK